MVDERRVALLLRRTTDDLALLHGHAAEDRAALAADDVRLAAVKYRFVTAIEGIVNVAQHLCASEGWGPPADNGDAVRLLGRHGVLDTDLAGRAAAAVGFRNVLVHRYADVDDARVVAALDGLGDLDAFVDAVAAWLPAGQ